MGRSDVTQIEKQPGCTSGQADTIDRRPKPGRCPAPSRRLPFAAGEAFDKGADKPVALVVDDDPLVRRALVRQLCPEFRVRQATSQAEALTILTECARAGQRDGKEPRGLALAFIDFELPDGTGESVLRRLQAWPDAISVLMSANAAEMRRFRSCGALVPIVLDKPLTQSSILAAKRAALSVPNS